MNNFASFLNLMLIIYPKFYTAYDTSKNELVFLKTNEPELHAITVTDKTQCEAVSNHFHIFDKVGQKNYDYAIDAGKTIANNLLNSLTQTFPSKKFVVYLEVNVKDSVTIRFHQVWDNEPPYFDMTQNYGDITIFELR